MSELVIDIHTHIIPEHLPDWAAKFGYGAFIRLEHHKPCCARMMQGDKFFREIEDNCWSGERRIEQCNHHHVSVQVLSTIPVMFSYWAKPKDGLEISQYLNDHLAEVVSRNPTRFVGLGTVPMQDTDLAIQELERCMKELGFAGVQIGSNIDAEGGEFNLSDKRLFPFYEAAEKLGAAIFVHPWNMMGTDKMSKYWLPWLVGMPAETSRAICSMIFGGVFEQFPKLRVAFAHGGGSFPFTIGRIEHGWESRPDLVAIDNAKNPRDYLGKFYFDSLVHDKMALKYLVELVGAERVALGTDYPFPLGEDVPGKLIREAGFDAATQQQLLSTTALEWMGIDGKRFT